MNDGAERTLELSPHLAYFALAPFIGAEDAVAEALRAPPESTALRARRV